MDAPYDPVSINSSHPGWCTGIGQLLDQLICLQCDSLRFQMQLFYNDILLIYYLSKIELVFEKIDVWFNVALRVCKTLEEKTV